MSHEKGRLPTIDAALEQFSRVAVALDIEQKLEARLQEFLRQPESQKVPSGPVTPRTSRRQFVRSSIAVGLATFVLAALFVAFGSRDAWAQVAKTVRSKPWVRFTFQTPKGTAVPNGHPAPETRETWVSVEHKVAAGRMGQAAHFIDLARQVCYDYDPRTKSLSLWQTRDQDVDIGFLDTLLGLIAGGDDELKLSRTPIKIVGRTRSEVQDGNRRWIEFKFDCRNPPREFLMIVRVDPETQLPVQLRTTERLSPNNPAVEQTVVIDYPETGPSDIYALGVPRNAPIVDQRRSRKTENGEEIKTFLTAYVQARKKPFEPFSMTVLASLPEKDFSEIYQAIRGRDDGRDVRLEEAKPEDLFEITRKVRAGQITRAEDVDRAEWWKQQIAGLTFTPTQQFYNGLLPNRVGYPTELMEAKTPSPIDNPDCHVTLDRHPRLGPPGTVLLNIRVETTIGNDLFFWIAPEKDYLVLRQEIHYSKDRLAWHNLTRIIDKVEQSPKGRWYATKLRYGRIEKHGDDLPAESVKPRLPLTGMETGMEIGPVSTVVYRYLVEFK